MNYFQRRKLLKQINSLELVPVAIVPFEESEGTVKLIVPKFSNQILTRMFVIKDKKHLMLNSTRVEVLFGQQLMVKKISDIFQKN
jgi:hypothetical protein